MWEKPVHANLADAAATYISEAFFRVEGCGLTWKADGLQGSWYPAILLLWRSGTNFNKWVCRPKLESFITFIDFLLQRQHFSGIVEAAKFETFLKWASPASKFWIPCTQYHAERTSVVYYAMSWDTTDCDRKIVPSSAAGTWAARSRSTSRALHRACSSATSISCLAVVVVLCKSRSGNAFRKVGTP